MTDDQIKIGMRVKLAPDSIYAAQSSVPGVLTAKHKEAAGVQWYRVLWDGAEHETNVYRACDLLPEDASAAAGRRSSPVNTDARFFCAPAGWLRALAVADDGTLTAVNWHGDVFELAPNSHKTERLTQ